MKIVGKLGTHLESKESDFYLIKLSKEELQVLLNLTGTEMEIGNSFLFNKTISLSDVCGVIKKAERHERHNKSLNKQIRKLQRIIQVVKDFSEEVNDGSL